MAGGNSVQFYGGHGMTSAVLCYHNRSTVLYDIGLRILEEKKKERVASSAC